MKEAFKGELIGKAVAVKGTPIGGKIIDETRNMVTIETEKGHKKMVKKNHTFIIKTATGSIEVPGETIAARPEDRIRQKW